MKLRLADRLSPEGIVDDFSEQWNQSDLRDVMPMPEVVANGQLVELGTIGVYDGHQKRGYASRALRMLTALCDENKITIKLVARPLGSILPGCPPTLSTEELVAWYRRHGFAETKGAGDDTREMIREPRVPS